MEDLKSRFWAFLSRFGGGGAGIEETDEAKTSGQSRRQSEDQAEN